jgi:hypothetical protein
MFLLRGDYLRRKSRAGNRRREREKSKRLKNRKKGFSGEKNMKNQIYSTKREKSMRKNLMFMAAFLIIFAVGFQTVAAQFPKIPKIPKIEKPKVEQPKTDGDSSVPQNPGTTKTGGQIEYMVRPEATSAPVFMKESVEIGIKSNSRYWKVPNQDYYTSWLPQVSFDLFFDNSVKMRYTAEWFNPDGTPWFSEPLKFGTTSAYSTVRVAGEYSTENFASKASVETGNYGLKITNSKTNEVVFQGKFKVNKIPLSPGDARRKNEMMFYVDNDWSLPVGYVGFTYSGDTSWDYDPKPIVFMWFKGDLDGSLFEARLFHGGQEIGSTDDGGVISSSERRGEDCFQNPEVCRYHLWKFKWDKFIVENEASVRKNNPKATFTRDKPGEYTAKIFYKGAQVRETKFTIDQKGWIAPNEFSKQIYLTNYKVVVPVKVLGNLEKWNASAWKTDAFYGNPLSGFAAP